MPRESHRSRSSAASPSLESERSQCRQLHARDARPDPLQMALPSRRRVAQVRLVRHSDRGA